MQQSGSEDKGHEERSQSSSTAKITESESIGDVVSRFIQEIDSLSDTLPLAMRSIGNAYKQAHDSLQSFFSEHGLDTRGESKKITIRVDDVPQLRTLTRGVERIGAANKLVPRSFLVTIVSQYDAFLGRLIHSLMLIKPQVINSSDKTLSFSELVSFGSVEAARDHIIEKEVESVLRKSHAEQFDWLENKFSVKLRQDLDIWPHFIEITERRNLFVHTSGKVSSQYLQICQNHHVDCGATKRGDVLEVDPSYYRRAHLVMFQMGVKLAHVLWRKVSPNDLEKADLELNRIAYNLLAEEKYDLAKAVLDFAVDVLKKHSSAGQRLQLVINRAQAYKWSGDDERASNIYKRKISLR